MVLPGSRSSSFCRAILVVAAALLCLGMVMVFSASASLTAPPPTENFWKNSAVRQTLFTCAALLAMLLVSACPHHFWRIRQGKLVQPSVILALISVGLLVATLLFGEIRNGARRWLALGPPSLGLGFQPSEVAKVAVVVFLSAFCAWRGDAFRRFWTGFLPAILVLGLIAGLIGKEDFGTAALIAAAGACIILATGAKIWHMILATVPGAAGFAYLVIDEPYRMQRLTSFLDPYADPQGQGYHQIQSLITIASGGWWGRGLGCGIQKYGYLPEGRSDFIFAVICEELGIVGGLAVIGLFAILLWHGRKAAISAATDFGRLLAIGATLTIGLQAAMNIAVVTVAVPTKGIGLPLVSAGGSGVLFLGVLVGLLANVARYHHCTAVTLPVASELQPPRPTLSMSPPVTTGSVSAGVEG